MSGFPQAFLRAHDRLHPREAGLANHASDRGGLTLHGLTQRTYDGWRREQGQALRPVSMATWEEIQLIFWSWYWRPAGCDGFGWHLSLYVFDAAIHHGVSRGVRLLQAVIGADPDGTPGPQTFGLAEEVGPHRAAGRLLWARARFMGAIVRDDRTQGDFIHGWLNRLDGYYREDLDGVVGPAVQAPPASPPTLLLSSTPQIMEELERITLTGLWGRTVAQVAATLLHERVREVMAEGWAEDRP